MAKSKNDNQICLTPQQQFYVSLAMPRIAKMVEKELRKAAGTQVPFSFFTWGGDRSQHVANINRLDAMAVMQEALDRWRRHEPDLGAPHLDGKNEPHQ